MIKIQLKELEDLEAYYSNIGEEKLIIKKDLEPEKIGQIIKKIEKDRPAHSRPVGA